MQIYQCSRCQELWVLLGDKPSPIWLCNFHQTPSRIQPYKYAWRSLLIFLITLLWRSRDLMYLFDYLIRKVKRDGLRSEDAIDTLTIVTFFFQLLEPSLSAILSSIFQRWWIDRSSPKYRTGKVVLVVGSVVGYQQDRSLHIWLT
jgi:hypothetical protein